MPDAEPDMESRLRSVARDTTPPGGPGSGGIDSRGIADSRVLPDDEFSALWDAIIVEPEIKERLLAHTLLNFTLRPRLSRADLPMHGVLLLTGAPGTGKTSLAKGLASRAAEKLQNSSPSLYIEVDPHALASASLGKSQKAVTDLLGTTIAEHASLRPTLVLLDEVETLAADRTKLSLEANPIDVHRATDAVLTQLDALADRYPNLLFIATSNFPQAIDGAFLSRADLVVTIDLPNADACRAILTATVKALARVYSPLRSLLDDPDFERCTLLCHGLDGRRIRKIVVNACALRQETAIDPSLLTARDLLRAVELAQGDVGSIGPNGPEGKPR